MTYLILSSRLVYCRAYADQLRYIRTNDTNTSKVPWTWFDYMRVWLSVLTEAVKYTQIGWWCGTSKEGGGKGIKNLVTKGNLTLGGEYTVQYVYDMLLNCTLETYLLLLMSPQQMLRKEKKKLPLTITWHQLINQSSYIQNTFIIQPENIWVSHL